MTESSARATPPRHRPRSPALNRDKLRRDEAKAQDEDCQMKRHTGQRGHAGEVDLVITQHSQTLKKDPGLHVWRAEPFGTCLTAYPTPAPDAEWCWNICAKASNTSCRGEDNATDHVTQHPTTTPRQALAPAARKPSACTASHSRVPRCLRRSACMKRYRGRFLARVVSSI